MANDQDPDIALFDSLISQTSDKDPDKALFDSLIPASFTKQALPKIGMGERLRLDAKARTGADETTLSATAGDVSLGLNELGRTIQDGALQQLYKGEARQLFGAPVPFTKMSDWRLNEFSTMAGITVPFTEHALKSWDENEGKKIEDPVQRKEERVKFVSGLAGEVLKERLQNKVDAGQELSSREKTLWAKIGGGFVKNAGYTGAFMVGAPMAIGVSAGRRFGDLQNDEQALIDGNIETVDQGDSVGKSALKAVPGAVTEWVIEERVGRVYRWLGGKAIANTIGKNPAAAAALEKLSNSGVGKAFQKFYKLGEVTGTQSLPEEVFENLEGDLADKGLGLDKRDSEKLLGWKADTVDATKQFMTKGNLADQALEMFLQVAISGGAAGAAEYNQYAKYRNTVDGTLAAFGADPEKLKKASLQDKQQVAAAIRQNLTPEMAQTVIERLGNKAGDVYNSIVEQEGYDFDAKKNGIVSNFKLPPAGSDSRETLPDGSKLYYHAESGIGIVEHPDGRATVYDRNGDMQSFPTLGDAVEAANKLSVKNQVVDMRRGQKAKYVEATARRLASDVNVQVHNTTDDLLAAVPEAAQSPDFEANPSGINLNGTIHVVLDNINTPRGVVSTILHEAGVHTGLARVLKGDAKNQFLSNLGSAEAGKYKDFVQKLGYAGGADNTTEEALAYMYEQRLANPTGFQKGVAWIHEQLRKVNPDYHFTDADIEVMMADAQQSVRNAQRGAVNLPAPVTTGKAREQAELNAYERKALELEESYPARAETPVPVAEAAPKSDLNAESKRRMEEDPQAWIESVRAAKGDIQKAVAVYDSVREETPEPAAVVKESLTTEPQAQEPRQEPAQSTTAEPTPAQGEVAPDEPAAPPEPETQTMLDEKQYPAVELPLEGLTLSKDVPQFKENSDPKTGEVEPIKGSGYVRLGTAPIVVWERLDGRKEIVTGRHRVAFARRVGEQTIPAQVVREADGFGVEHAITLDAESNIRDGQGSAKDYANYFRNVKITEQEASGRGLLGRDKGKRGFQIGRNASPDLYALFRDDKIGESKAASIAESAPGNPGVQQVGIRYAEKHTSEETRNYMRSLLSMAPPEQQGKQLDLLGFDTSWQEQSDKRAKAASRIASRMGEELSALKAARSLSKEKRAAIVGKYGFKAGDAGAVEGRIAALESEVARFDNWHLNPDLVQMVSKEAGEQAPSPALNLESVSPDQIKAEAKRRDDAKKIADGAAKPLTGTAGDLTPDMFGPSDTPLFDDRRDTLPSPAPVVKNGDVAKSTPKPKKAQEQESQPKPQVKTPTANLSATDQSRLNEIQAKLRQKLRGQANMGFDPEILTLSGEMAILYAKGGIKTFSQFASRVKSDMSDMWDQMKQYLHSAWQAAGATDDTLDDVSRKDAAAAISVLDSAPSPTDNNPEREADNEPDSSSDMAQGGRPAQTADVVGGSDVQHRRGRDGAGDSRGSERGASQAGSAERGDSGVSDGVAADDGAVRDTGLSDGTPAVSGRIAGSAEQAGGGRAGDARMADDGSKGDSGPSDASSRDVGADQSPLDSSDPKERRAAQTAADRFGIVRGNSVNISKTLPLLLKSQQSDVLKAETRFAKPDGFGMMFTNGTGTGKTYSGMGIVKRYVREGRDNILIVAPNQEVINGWVKTGKDLGVKVNQLGSTADNGGKGVVVTTYSNLGMNKTLADRSWDLVVADESQNLLSKKDSDVVTLSGDALRAITLHPRGKIRRAQMLHRDLYKKLEEAKVSLRGWKALAEDDHQYTPQAIEAEKEHDRALVAVRNAENTVSDYVDAHQADRTRVVFLSATPFAYVKNIDYAEGYLFDYGKDEGSRGYNQPSAQDRYLMSNFGYKMRYNRLEAPGPDVNSDVMERQWSSNMTKSGAVSGRRIDIKSDYERRFALTEDSIGTEIDNGMKFLREADKGRFMPLHDHVQKKFDYLSRMYLLESLKARHAVPIIKQWLKSGNKVVVFHDYNQGGGFNPFSFDTLPPTVTVRMDDKYVEIKTAPLVEEFFARNPAIASMDFTGLSDPITAMLRAFPNAGQVNGTRSGKQIAADLERFNSDDSGPSVIIVQAQKGGAGISLHDTTGKHPRREINLGLPSRPVTAIQEEGRIYRVGQHPESNALFLYMNTGTNWEAQAFARKMFERGATAENLAMGEQARRLRQSYVEGFRDSSVYSPSQEDGRGGKLSDAAQDAISDYERAKSYYFGRQKKTARDKSREGADYFATPEPLGMKMVEWSGVKDGESILEPSAGHGAISRFFPETAKNVIIEPSNDLYTQAILLGNANTKPVRGTFEDHDIHNKYDAIDMNPPFGVGGKTAVEHIAKAFNHLREGGRIVAIIPQGPSADKRFDAWYGGQKGAVLIRSIGLPQVTFDRAGTSVKTRVVIIDKYNGEKEANEANANSSGHIEIEAQTVKGLFDKIEDMDVPERIKVENVSPLAAELTSRRDAVLPEQSADSGEESPDIATVLHTKKNANIFIVKPKVYMSPDKYKSVASAAKAAGGWYSRKFGTSPSGFAFETMEAADKFARDNADVFLSKPSGVKFRRSDADVQVVMSEGQTELTNRPDSGTIIEASDDIRYRLPGVSLDADYLRATEAGDRGGDNLVELLRKTKKDERDKAVAAWLERNPETAERLEKMVVDRARAMGYDIKAYHATNNDFNVFDRGRLGSETAKNSPPENGMALSKLGFWFHEKPLAKELGQRRDVSAFIRLGESEDKSFDELWDNPEMNGDSLVVDDSEFGGKSYVIRDSTQIKSADAVTYDDAGRIIPPSERFNEASDDIRFRRSDADVAKLLAEIEREEVADSFRALPSVNPKAREMQADVQVSYAYNLTPKTVQQSQDEARGVYEKDKTTAQLNLLSGYNDSGDINSDARRMAVDKIAVDDMTVDAVSAPSDDNKIATAMLGIWRWYERGTDVARALRLRFDPVDTPEGRRAWLMRTILAPTKGEAEIIRRAESTAAAIDGLKRKAKFARAVLAKLKAKDRDVSKLTADQLMDDEIIADILRDISTARSGWGDVVHEWWRNAILSAPTTQIVNTIGNAGNAALEAFIQRPVEAIINTVAKNERAASINSVRAMYRAITPSIGAANTAFLKSWSTEKPVTGDSSKIEESNAAIGGTFGKVVRIPQRAMTATDEWFKTVFMAMLTADYATREFDRLVKSGKQGEDNREGYLLAQINPLSASYAKAWGETLRWSFQQKPGNMASAIMHWRNDPSFGFWLKFIFPFVKTPANIISSGIRKTPANALPYIYKLATGKYSSEDAMRLGAEQAVGLVFMSVLYAMMSGDDDDPLNRPRITGSRKTSAFSPKGEKESEMQDYPPMSIRVGDKWIRYARLEPFATMTSTMVDALTAWHQAKNGHSADIPATVFASIRGNLSDKTFLQGVGNLVSIVEGDEFAMSRAVTGTLAGFNPNIIRSTARAFDPYIRETRTKGTGIGAAAQRFSYQALPAAFNAPEPKIDKSGKPIEREGSGVYNAVVPFAVQSAVKTTKIDAMVKRWNENVPSEKRWWPSSPVAAEIVYGKEKIKMTDGEYAEYKRVAGEIAERRLSVKTFNYDRPKERDIERLKEVYEDARASARGRVRSSIIRRWKSEQKAAI